MKTKELLEYDWEASERRGEDRDVLPDTLRILGDHMHKIKRALDSGNVDIARKLVNGAIRALSSQHVAPFE